MVGWCFQPSQPQRVISASSVDNCAEIESAPSVAEPVLAEFGGRCRKAMQGVCNSLFCTVQWVETMPTVNVAACCSVCDPVRPQTGPREVRSGVRGGTVLSGPHDCQRHPSRRQLYRLHVQRGPAKSTLSDCGHFCSP